MIKRADVKIGDNWLVADSGFIFHKKEISMPEPKLSIIEIPGTSNVIDLTEEVSGDVQYYQREIMIVLEDGSGKDSYYSRISELSNEIHGQKKKIIFSKDAGFYWIGRIEVESAESRHYGTTFVINATVDPYKYEVHDSLLPWDAAEAVEGSIVREYKNLTVPRTMTIEGRRKPVQPVFDCSQAMTVGYLANTYQLKAGKNRVPYIVLGKGIHTLVFTGAGTVSIEYRGGSL